MTALFGGSELRRALRASLDVLRSRRASIDAANVYPVPDGDTGTNLVLTFEALDRALARVSEDPAETAHAAKTGSLMGARGNSGVIMAQILRGLCEPLEAGPVDAARLAEGFKRAVELAYEAVLEPAEGTILTVARAAAEAAQGDHATVADQFDAAVRAAASALARTPEQLPVLAQAGVVDAGGMGLLAVLEAFAASLGGRELPAAPPSTPSAPAACEMDADGHAYEVQYVLEARDEIIPPLRQLLGAMGDSVAVIGGDGLWRVHVHTDERDRVVALGRVVGTVTDVDVTSFAEQFARTASSQGEAQPTRRSPGQRGIEVARAETPVALVAVAAGDGMKRMFADLGGIVVDGGQTMNPSVADLLEGIRAAPSSHVIVLPNNDNVFAAAGMAKQQASKEITLLRTTDMAQGLAAALAFGDARSPADNLMDMQRAVEQVRTGQVSIATRDADTPVGPIRQGQALGFAEGALIAAERSDDPILTAVAVVEALTRARDEVLTVVCGADADEGERARLRHALATRFPALSLEVHDGGQPVHRYLISVE